MRFIDAGSVRCASDELVEIVRQGRSNKAVILLDTTLGDSFDGAFFLKTMDLRRRETVSMIVPLCKEVDMEFATNAILSIDPDHCMINAIDFGFASMAKWKNYECKLSQFPVWQTESLGDNILKVIKRSGKYGYLPPLPELRKYFSDFSDHIDSDMKPVVQNVINYIDCAALNIHKHILKNTSFELW